MKITAGVLIGLTIGCIIYNSRDEAMLTSLIKDTSAYVESSDDRFYVALKFAKTGKLLQLSDKFDDHYNCLQSDDYQIHTAASKESGSQIICTNQPSDYKL